MYFMICYATSPDCSGNPFLPLFLREKRLQRKAGNSSKKKYFMKKTVCIIVAFLALVSCSQKVVPADLAKINGYWEVEKVVFDSIDDKEYKMNEVYDYFKIANAKGIRKKVMPQLDGTFLVNDVQEDVTVRFDEEGTFLDYKTSYMKWSEEIITLTDTELVLMNKEKVVYHYKKAAPINLLGDGKTTK